MSRNLDIQGMSIVLAVRDHNPALLTTELLKGSDIVPADWELARLPVLNQDGAQVNFRNGINIAAQRGMITFSQSIAGGGDLERAMVGDVAQKYVRALPNLDYLAVGINPQRFVTFGDRSDGAYKYITENILCHYGWQDVGDEPMQASVNLAYKIKGVPLRLNISEVRLQMPEAEKIPAVLFAGNFHHELGVESGTDRLSAVLLQIESWPVDWDIYHDLLVNKFFSKSRSDWVRPIEDDSGVGLLSRSS